MTDKEFKRLSRSQLIDIIYQLQLEQEKLKAENEKLSKALADKRLRISNVGNIAEAALEINKVLEAAQAAATQYLDEIQLRATSEYQRVLKEAQDEADTILADARSEAAGIAAQGKTKKPEVKYDVESILREFKRGR